VICTTRARNRRCETLAHVGIGVAVHGLAMYFEDTLLVRRVELAPRALAQSFAPVRKRQWPWIIAAAVVLVSALANPLVAVERQVRAQELRASLTGP
jgi:hypothetical protein